MIDVLLLSYDPREPITHFTVPVLLKTDPEWYSEILASPIVPLASNVPMFEKVQ